MDRWLLGPLLLLLLVAIAVGAVWLLGWGLTSFVDSPVSNTPTSSQDCADRYSTVYDVSHCLASLKIR